MLALLYLTLALVLAGALALRAVTQQSLYSAVWETIAGGIYDECCRLSTSLTAFAAHMMPPDDDRQ